MQISLLNSITSILAAVAVFAATPASAVVAQGEYANTMHIVIKIDENGNRTQEAVVGPPLVVDGHMSIQWAGTKLNAATLAQLPTLTIGAPGVANTVPLGSFETAHYNARYAALRNYMPQLGVYLKANGINLGWVDVKQRVVHKGIVKEARNSAFVWPSGYWHTNLVKVRRIGADYKVFYAAYRPLRDLYSEAEADEVPPSKDANYTSGRQGLWLNVKNARTWADITAPAPYDIRDISAGNKAGLFFANSNYPLWSPTNPNDQIYDPAWPAKCLLDRVYVDTLGSGRACPNNTDIKTLQAGHDVDFTILDMYDTVQFRDVPTATPGTFTRDFRLNVTSRVISCPDPANIFIKQSRQQGVLTGTAMVTVDRYLMFPDNSVRLMQTFKQPYAITYPYTATFSYQPSYDWANWQNGNDACGRVRWRMLGNYWNSGYWWNERYCAAETNIPTLGADFQSKLVLSPSVKWWRDGDRGPYPVGYGYLEANTEGKAMLIEGVDTNANNYTIAPSTFDADSCSPLPSCPFGQSMVNGVCTVPTCANGETMVNGTCRTNVCPPGQSANQAGVCEACPAPGMTRDSGGACVCPTCTVLGSTSNGLACVTDPAPTAAACSGIQSCESQNAAEGVTCDRYRVQIGGVPPSRCSNLPGTFIAGASVALNNCACPAGQYWEISTSQCLFRQKDQCVNIPGIQETVPAGMIQTSSPQGPRCDPTSSLGSICACAGGQISASDLGDERTVIYQCDDPGGRTRSTSIFNRVTRRIVSTQSTLLGPTRIAECATPSTDQWSDWLQ